jgi:hypothetical protein
MKRMKSMCPDHQILSVYLDKELPSPWKEKMESHLSQCAQCRERLASYRLSDATPEFSGFSLQQAQDRVWSRLQKAGIIEENHYSETNHHMDSPVFWHKKISIPFPAAAAAAVLILALAALWLRQPAVSDPRDTEIAAGETLDMQGMMPLADMSGVLQYLSSKDTGDYVILRLPESKNFISSGEPAIIKAADYSRRNSGR